VPLSTLTTAPFSLTLGSNINAKLVAVNAYGDSSESSFGGGAVILLVPDAPLSLANAPAITKDYQIGLTWLQGASIGGTAIIDYQIQFDEGMGGDFVVLVTGVTD
jgi:hypothetical protein